MAQNRINPNEVQKYLSGVNYPVSKEDLISHARRNRASEDIISMLEGMRTNRFNSPADISREFNE